MNSSRIILWLSLALVLSVSVNMFGAGWYLGQYDREPARPAASGMRATLDALARDLSPASARLLRQTLRARADQVRPELQALRQARRDLRDVLAGEPLDRAAVAEAQARIRAATGALQAALHQTLAEVAAAMPAEDRRLLARFREDFR